MFWLRNKEDSLPIHILIWRPENTIELEMAWLALNPFKPNGISHSYQLDQSISILRIVGQYFSGARQFVENHFADTTIGRIHTHHICEMIECSFFLSTVGLVISVLISYSKWMYHLFH